jgi:hypothetical protein
MAQALMPGTITLLCGMGGSSKSLLISHASIYWLKNNVPFAVFHLEKDREFHQLRALAQLEGDSRLTDAEWCRDNPDTMVAALDRHRPTLNRLAERIWDAPGVLQTFANLERWLIDRGTDGCRVLVIDPITAADSGDKPWISEKKFMLNIGSIVRRFGASLILVTHPKDGSKQMKGRLDAHGGSQNYSRFADNVINLESNQPKSVQIVEYTPAGTQYDDVNSNRVLSIRKSREGKGTGWDIAMWFEPNTLKFKELGLICE